MTTHDKELEWLCLALQASLTNDGDRLCVPRELDWQYLRAQSRRHRIGALLYLVSQHKASYLPADVVQDWREHYQQTFLHNTLIYQQYSLFVRECARYEIFPILLKGIFLAKQVYGDIGLRPMQDIDLLLKTDDISNAQEILDGLGYTLLTEHLTYVSEWHKAHEQDLLQGFRGQGYHVPIRLKSFGAFRLGIELHHHLTPTLAFGQVKTFDLADADFEVHALQPEYCLLHLCYHLHKHAREGNAALLIWYYDIARLLDVYRTTLNWALLCSLAEEFQIADIVANMLDETAALFSLPRPTMLRKPPALRQDVLQRLFLQPEPSPDRDFVRSLFKHRSKKDGLRYLWDCLFPSRAFMRQRYQATTRREVLRCYLLRLWNAARRAGKLLVLRVLKN